MTSYTCLMNFYYRRISGSDMCHVVFRLKYQPCQVRSEYDDKRENRDSAYWWMILDCHSTAGCMYPVRSAVLQLSSPPASSVPIRQLRVQLKQRENKDVEKRIILQIPRYYWVWEKSASTWIHPPMETVNSSEFLSLNGLEIEERRGWSLH